MSSPTPDQVRRWVHLVVDVAIGSAPREFLSEGRAMNARRRIAALLVDCPEYRPLLDRIADEVVTELPEPDLVASDVPGSVVKFAQGRAR